MVNTEQFSKRLQKMLEFYGISATALSEKLAVNRSTISHLLAGRNKPSLEFVMKVLQEFPEVELYWLLNGTGTFPSSSSSPNIEPPVLDLPNTEISPIEKKENVIDKDRTDSTPNIIPTSDIDQIVIFYKDGSFKAYK